MEYISIRLLRPWFHFKLSFWCCVVCVGLTFVALLIDVLGLDQPVHVADHVLLHLFALLRLLQLTSGHRLLSFLGEFSARAQEARSAPLFWLLCPLPNCERQRSRYEPAQHTQHKVDDEKGAKDDQRNKVDPGDLVANGVVHLHRDRAQRGCRLMTALCSAPPKVKTLSWIRGKNRSIYRYIYG